MLKTYIAILLLSIFIVLFALQNAEPVWVYLWAWSIKSPLSLVIIFSMAIGTVLSFLVSFIEFRKMRKLVQEKKEEIKEKDIQITALEKKIVRSGSYNLDDLDVSENK